MNPLTQSKNATILPVLIALTLGCFGLSPQAQAVCREGCDTSTAATFLGENALVNNGGTSNTAIGANALNSNTSGAANTAVGSAALLGTPPAKASRPSVFLRSGATPPATSTPPRVRMRSSKTPSAATTRPSVIMRSMQTQPVTPTQPSAAVRWVATPAAVTTRPLASAREIKSPGTIILTSATQGLQLRLGSSASAPLEPKRRLLSRALGRRRLLVA